MTLGYLHLGAPEHGVTRYGQILAGAARQHLDTEIVEAHVEEASTEALQVAARRLASADVVHVQYNGQVWGGPRRARRRLQAFFEQAPPIVVTIHDVRAGGYDLAGVARRLGRMAAERFRRAASRESLTPSEAEAAQREDVRDNGLRASLLRAVRYFVDEQQNARATRWLTRHAARVLVCSEEERGRLRGVPGAPERLAVIPHFVEARELPASRHSAKEQLGLASGPVLTVLGFIHRSKGHALALEALPLLPDDVRLVFAGAPGADGPHFADELRQRAEALGVADRLRITGYLSEEELNLYLAATDMALCPFKSMAASGSLSTWVAAGRPLLASDLPQVAEYNRMAPGAISTFSPNAPEALAVAVQARLGNGSGGSAAAREVLRQRLAPARIIREHAVCYWQAVCAGTGHAANNPPGSA